MTGTGYDDDVTAVETDLTRLIRRLESLTARATAQRRPALTALVRELARLDLAIEEGPSDAAVPGVPDHGLADAVAVIGDDLLAALHRRPDRAAADRMAAALRAALDATR